MTSPFFIGASPPLPLVQELQPVPDVLHALRAVADWPGVVLLDSALVREHVGRYSYLMADPFRIQMQQSPAYGVDPFAEFRQRLPDFRAQPLPELPPFQGGVAGLLSYELGATWERIPPALHNEFAIPALAIGWYDWVLAWDHACGRAWIVSHGWPESDHRARRRRAAMRIEGVVQRLQSPHRPSRTAVQSREPSFSSPQIPLPGAPGVFSNFSRDEYLAAVERVIEYIRAGDIFQANLSQRLLTRFDDSPLELYARLRECNPAPFAGYAAFDDWAVVSASPERFIRLQNGEVETRPIKGTRRRGILPESDLFRRDELRESEKDQAENVMIVDLLRNDLSRVCQPGSIRVPRLCAVETYETVQHLVSEVRGQLAEDAAFWDLIGVVFPGGSITGAPKVRAMEIIAELEPTVRGPYCGSLFWLGYDGAADSNILIRTFTCRGGWAQFPVGGGIVAQSHPVAEYEETLHKAEGLLRALAHS